MVNEVEKQEKVCNVQKCIRPNGGGGPVTFPSPCRLIRLPERGMRSSHSSVLQLLGLGFLITVPNDPTAPPNYLSFSLKQTLVFVPKTHFVTFEI